MHTNPFATEAAQYAHLRPTYPESLFAFLSKTVASRDVARYFGRVIATDESAQMIGQAPPPSKDRIPGLRGRGFGHRCRLCRLGNGSFRYPLVRLRQVLCWRPPRREVRRGFSRLDLLHSRVR